MEQLKSKQEYIKALNRIDKLLPLTWDNESMDNPYELELAHLSELVAEYEDIHYPIGEEKHERFGSVGFEIRPS